MHPGEIAGLPGRVNGRIVDFDHSDATNTMLTDVLNTIIERRFAVGIYRMNLVFTMSVEKTELPLHWSASRLPNILFRSIPVSMFLMGEECEGFPGGPTRDD
jgi:hypothetical protein